MNRTRWCDSTSFQLTNLRYAPYSLQLDATFVGHSRLLTRISLGQKDQRFGVEWLEASGIS